MRLWVLIVLLIICFTVSGCFGNRNIPASTNEIEQENSEGISLDDTLQQESFNDSSIDDKLLQESSGDFSLDGMTQQELFDSFTLLSNEDETELILYNSANDETFVITSDWGRFTEPQISPDKTKIAFVHPFEFEELGYVNIYHIKSKKKQEVDFAFLAYGENGGNKDDENDYYIKKSPHELIWLDNSSLLVNMTNLYGTMGYGSEIFYFDIGTDNCRKVISIDDSLDNVEKIHLKNNSLEITAVKYDDNAMEIVLRKVFEVDPQTVYELFSMGETLELSMDE